MRKRRAVVPLTAAEKMKDNCRSYAQVYLKRGKIQRLPCVSCASPAAQMHHEDYTKPLAIVWMCRECRMKLPKISKPGGGSGGQEPQNDPFACIRK